MTIFLLIAAGYLLGSIPFGVILTRLFGAGDLRQIGSGNIGATNVMRAGGKGLAAATLVLDALKATAAILLARELFDTPGTFAAAGALIGHLYPAWLRFKGGKGVATYIGVLAGTAAPAALAFIAIWLATAFVSRYSSLSALIAATATPPILALLGNWPAVGLFTVLTILVYIRHHANISRLLKGEESRIGGKSG